MSWGRGAGDKGAGSKRKHDEALKVHDFEVREEWSGNFIVLGTTGSGKTTLIKYMTTHKINDMGHGTNMHRTSLSSQTTESKLYKTPKITMPDGVEVSLKLRDTVGFGAKDMETRNILKDTFLEVVTDFEKIRGCILVHKCERFREGGYKDLECMKRMLERMGLKFDQHLLLVITHTGHLSDETKKSYADELKETVLPDIPADRIMHVNFANMDELNEYHQKFYQDTAKTEFSRMVGKLREFEDEIAPGGKDLREHFDNSYDEDLNKKGVEDLKKKGVASKVTDFLGRLSGGEEGEL